MGQRRSATQAGLGSNAPAARRHVSAGEPAPMPPRARLGGTEDLDFDSLGDLPDINPSDRSFLDLLFPQSAVEQTPALRRPTATFSPALAARPTTPELRDQIASLCSSDRDREQRRYQAALDSVISSVGAALRNDGVRAALGISEHIDLQSTDASSAIRDRLITPLLEQAEFEAISYSASSIVGSLSANQFCIRCTRSIDASGYGGRRRPAFG
jgi:hypothetical protein